MMMNKTCLLLSLGKLLPEKRLIDKKCSALTAALNKSVNLLNGHCLSESNRKVFHHMEGKGLPERKRLKVLTQIQLITLFKK
jgi:hypothetical protein